MTDDWSDRITLNPAVLAGKPTVRGPRISVEHILRALSAGVPESELLADYPDLEPDDLKPASRTRPTAGNCWSPGFSRFGLALSEGSSRAG